MGYYTHYELIWEPKSTSAEEYSCPIQNYIRANEETFYAIEPDGSTADSAKWYEHETDMRELSRKFPEVLFTLSGEGEESGDIWRKYFRAGCMQVARAVITIAPFDAAQLDAFKTPGFR